MNQDEWELEMNRMLDSFANQASSSLEKIDRRFEILGRSFDDEFRQYFMEMSNLRLTMTFNTYLYSRKPAQRNQIENRTNISNSPAEHLANSLKNEDTNNADLIEIYDSDDDDNHFDTKPAIVSTDEHMESTEEQQHSTDGMRNGIIAHHGNEPIPSVEAESNDANEGVAMIETCDANDDGPTERNEVKLFVKDESKAGKENDLCDLPLIEFDPNKENDKAVAASMRGQNNKTHRTGPSSNRKSNQSKRSAGDKRYRCKHCNSSFNFKSYLKKHQTVHAKEKLLGVKADSNGLYHCTLCIRRFTDVRHFSMHMKKSHKNDQYLYDCARCMLQFIQEADKDSHESQCEGHYYECHLCKVYVTKIKWHMENHMRTHSGAKPFRCMVCSKYFTIKLNLRSHLNTVHSRNRL